MKVRLRGMERTHREGMLAGGGRRFESRVAFRVCRVKSLKASLTLILIVAWLHFFSAPTGVPHSSWNSLHFSSDVLGSHLMCATSTPVGSHCTTFPHVPSGLGFTNTPTPLVWNIPLSVQPCCVSPCTIPATISGSFFPRKSSISAGIPASVLSLICACARSFSCSVPGK